MITGKQLVLCVTLLGAYSSFSMCMNTQELESQENVEQAPAEQKIDFDALPLNVQEQIIIIVRGYKPADNRKQVIAKINADLSKKTYYELTTQDFIFPKSAWEETTAEFLKPNMANRKFEVTLQSSTKMVHGAGNIHYYQLVKDKERYSLSIQEPRGIAIEDIVVITESVVN